jgi:hypothetical protein
VLVVLAAFLATPAAALSPTHPRKPALELVGAAPDPGSLHPTQPFNHACGSAVDSKGDVYVASAGNGAIDVFNAAHEYLTTIANPNQPCGLAVNGAGELFVVEQTTGNVVRYKPNAFPFTGTPTYGAAEPIDSSAQAKGVTVDPFDGRIYVPRGDRVTVYQASGAAEPASNETQRIRVIGPCSGGTYTLSFRGQTTAPLKYDATPAEIDAALEALSTIGPGNVAVTEEAPVGADVRRTKVTFEGALQNKTVPQLTGDGSKLGCSATSPFITTLTQGFSGSIEGGLTAATGAAVYTYKRSATTGDRYVFVADAATDQVRVFASNFALPETGVKQIEARGTIASADHDHNPGTPAQSFDFPSSTGAYLAVDPGNRDAAEKCASIAEQACTAGHLLVYDAGHNAVDEFEASGKFLDQLTDPALTDAQPTAMAVERSSGPNDGTIYISSGPAAGAKLLAFGPLVSPSRPQFDPPISRTLPGAQAVATDSRGNVYVAAGPVIHVFTPAGEELEVGPEGKGIQDPEVPLADLAIDSTGKVYVLEKTEPDQVTYYTPSAFPPTDGTAYTRHAPVATEAEVQAGAGLRAIAISPGPSAGKDHLFASSTLRTFEYDSAAEGSKNLRCLACSFNVGAREAIAVDGASGNVYLGSSSIAIVNPAGTELLAQIAGGGCPGGTLTAIRGIAVDQSNGHALVFAGSMGAAREYDGAGACVAEFGQFAKEGVIPGRIAIDSSCSLHVPPLSETTTPSCKEFDPGDGNAYVAFDEPGNVVNPHDVTAFEPLTYGGSPNAATGIAEVNGGGGATLRGTVNPNKFELTECRFEYLLDTEYVENHETFVGATSVPCAETPSEIGKGSDPMPVHADLTGLDPVRYRYRLLVANKYDKSDGGTWLFGPPVVTAKPALPVLYDEATLRAEVDPSGMATEYHFEYGTDESYGQSTPTIELAPGDGSVPVSAAITGLAEGVTYHFRAVAENEAGAAPGPDGTFATLERHSSPPCPNVAFRTGLSSSLPDCRAYELVTPAETNGLSPLAPDSGNPDTLFNNWLVDPRGAGAGERLSYFTIGTLPGFEGNGRFDGYHAQRGAGEHPVEGWQNELFGPSFEQAAPGSLHVPHQQGVSSDQRYSFWLMEPEDSFPGTFPAGVYLHGPGGFEALGQGSLGTDLKAVSKYVSAGAQHAIFSSKAQLQSDAPPAGTAAIFDRAAEVPNASVISVKPGGGPFAATEDATFVAATEDGSTVLFKVGGALYLHREGETVEVAEGPNTFAGVSEDGDWVFYAATSNGEAPAAIFACDVQAGPCAGPGAQAPVSIAANSIFLNVSADGSSAFFTSKDALTGSEGNDNGEVAEANERNLYAWDRDTDTTRFIAQLASTDFNPNAFEGVAGPIGGMNLGTWTKAISMGAGNGRAESPTRSTPDGRALVFQSHAQLTSYDNEGHGEIYRYEPAAGAGERLTCVSCDPSGSPAGADALLQDTGSPNFTGIVNQVVVPNVTDDGQAVFFQSFDRLLPEDANEVDDVYEWKAKGAEGCNRDGGCLALISSGQGDQPSFLYGMSADGHDVFFRTQEQLVGLDVAGSPSIYDARVEGGIPDPPAPEPCQGDACQGQGSPPPALAPPASNVPGEGNPPQGRRPCPKAKHRVKGRCVKKHRTRHRHRRAKHDRGARR